MWRSQVYGFRMMVVTSLWREDWRMLRMQIGNHHRAFREIRQSLRRMHGSEFVLEFEFSRLVIEVKHQ
jgi:hypothetical protein